MIPVAISLALALSAPVDREPPTPAPWRVVDAPGLHVGVRPALYLDNEADGRVEGGAGVSVQVTGFVF